MEFLKDDGRIYLRNEKGKKIAQLTYSDHLEHDHVWNADSVFVDESLRGQGIAEQLVDELVVEAKRADRKIHAVCPYVVSLFERKSDKYESIIFEDK